MYLNIYYNFNYWNNYDINYYDYVNNIHVNSYNNYYISLLSPWARDACTQMQWIT